MIPEGTTLYPEWFDYSQMYCCGEPYAYWLHETGQWILYKEYNSYRSVCHPNDCLSAINYDQVLYEFRNYCFYENCDREKLCRTFRQRSIDDPYDFEDFAEDLE